MTLTWAADNVGRFLALNLYSKGGGSWTKHAGGDMRGYGDGQTYVTDTLRDSRIKTGLTVAAALTLCAADHLCVGVVHERDQNR